MRKSVIAFLLKRSSLFSSSSFSSAVKAENTRERERTIHKRQTDEGKTSIRRNLDSEEERKTQRKTKKVKMKKKKFSD